MNKNSIIDVDQMSKNFNQPIEVNISTYILIIYHNFIIFLWNTSDILYKLRLIKRYNIIVSVRVMKRFILFLFFLKGTKIK